MAPSTGPLRPELRLRLHVRTLAEPLYFSIDEMIEAMRAVYQQAGITIEVASRAQLALPALRDLDIGPCVRGVLTLQQATLFGYRAGIGPTDIVVYFVRSTIPRSRGGAAHPENRPGAVVTRLASRCTLAHEVAHVLGLGHTADPARLMTSGDTSKIVVDVPALTDDEIHLMRSSPCLHLP